MALALIAGGPLPPRADCGTAARFPAYGSRNGVPSRWLIAVLHQLPGIARRMRHNWRDPATYGLIIDRGDLEMKMPGR